MWRWYFKSTGMPSDHRNLLTQLSDIIHHKFVSVYLEITCTWHVFVGHATWCFSSYNLNHCHAWRALTKAYDDTDHLKNTSFVPPERKSVPYHFCQHTGYFKQKEKKWNNDDRFCESRSMRASVLVLRFFKESYWKIHQGIKITLRKVFSRQSLSNNSFVILCLLSKVRGKNSPRQNFMTVPRAHHFWA